ncbi:uncharacterized protein RCC_06742 [Ramularia collo-cygni]|uniref:Uncharacterized protein n=1 Tax=Ramularia collo-cygni TaxID=112498 RepID=A0A2D3UTM7_9PEZI|nr:uncharacterized protein RCC_06742 [Ramularia collo-cygni]CZT20882.1 uncharacterized protein RCC_06742 [Ramularia collo-cygni]
MVPGTSKADDYAYAVRPKAKVEYAENDFREHTTVLESTFAIGYQQLWLFALGRFPQMSSVTTLMESDQGRPKATTRNPLLWKTFGQLVARVGFRGEQIDRNEMA